MGNINKFELDSLLFDEQGSAPTTPATGFWRVYAKSDGLYVVDDAGTETGPLAVSGGGGGGGGGDLVELASTTLGADGAISFSSISGIYRDLIITGVIRDDAAALSTASAPLMRVGNTSVDAGTNYQYSSYEIRSNGSATNYTNSVATATSLILQNQMSGNTNANFSHIELVIGRYATTDDPKMVTGRITTMFSSASNDHRLGMFAGAWGSTSAIDVVTIYGASFGNLVAGSTLTLYGRGTP